MKKIILFFFLIAAFGCSNGDVSGEIARLEKMHTQTPTSEVKKELAGQYKIHLKSLANDNNAYADAANKLATLQTDLNDYTSAAETLAGSLKDHSDGAKNLDNIQMLSDLLMERIHRGNPTAAFEQFSAIFPDKNALKENLNTILSTLQNNIFIPSTGRWDRKKVNYYISLCQLYAGVMPEDEKSQEHLFNAAKSANAVKKHDKAIQIYDYVLANADKFEKAPTALFLKGFAYDEHLKDYDKARVIYTEFLEKHPENVYAKDATSALANLGKTAEEIIQSFGK